MKILHLADLHLGKRVDETSFYDDQRFLINEIISAAVKNAVDAVIIAGDVYDKSTPSAEAVTLLDFLLSALAENRINAYIVSGNHDSAERLSYASGVFRSGGIYISGVYSGAPDKYTFEKNGERVNFYLLPFFKPVNARRFFPDKEINTYSEAMELTLSSAEIDEGETNILVTHQLVTGYKQSGSEELNIGGIDSIDLSLFSSFDYVALGHIHKKQSFSDGKIVYPGTPMKYSLSEAADEKDLTLITVNGKKITSEAVKINRLRDLREIRGAFCDIISGESDDYVYITLTDEDDVPEAVKDLQKKYPHLMRVRYDNSRTRFNAVVEAEEEESPLSAFSSLYLKQNNTDMNEEQTEFVKNIIDEIWGESI